MRVEQARPLMASMWGAWGALRAAAAGLAWPPLGPRGLRAARLYQRSQHCVCAHCNFMAAWHGAEIGSGSRRAAWLVSQGGPAP